MRGAAIGTLVSTIVLCECARATAQGDGQVAINACQSAAVRELRATHSEADSVRFSPGAKFSQTTSAATDVAGAGHYLEARTGMWKTLTFRCTYELRSGRTSGVAVRVGPASKRPRSLLVLRDSGQTAAGVCQSAVGNVVRSRHADAANVQFSSGANLRPQPNGETGVSGDGQYRTHAGWRSFSYECTYDARSGRPLGVSVEGA